MHPWMIRFRASNAGSFDVKRRGNGNRVEYNCSLAEIRARINVVSPRIVDVQKHIPQTKLKRPGATGRDGDFMTGTFL